MATPPDSVVSALRVISAQMESADAPSSELHRRWIELRAAGAPDAELVRLAFDACHSMVFTTASRITGTPWAAEDVVQNVFEAFVRKVPSLRDPAAVPGFLRTCAVRMAMKQVKRGRWRRRRLEEQYVPRGPVPEDGPARAALIRQLLEMLEPQERAAVVLKYVEQNSHDEVAELMGVSVPTARRRLAAARARLIAALGPDGARDVFGIEKEPA